MQQLPNECKHAPKWYGTQVDMAGKAWQKNANMHHGSLVISNTKCNKAILVSDLMKIRKTGAETDILLLYKQVQNYMQMISNMT